MSQVSSQDIEVRELQREDIPEVLNYFFKSSPEYLNSIGLRIPGPGEAEKFREMMEQRLTERENGAPTIEFFMVSSRGEKVGFHSATHRERGRSLIMHAHFFKEKFRGKGIGTVSYVLAIEKFIIECGYEEVIFKTPIQNTAPMKIKEKLGLQPVGEEVIDWPQLVHPLKVKVFRVTRSDLPKLKARVGLT